MLQFLREKFRRFFLDEKAYPILTIVVASTYALVYYYDKNYALINSKSQFLFLLSVYVFIPLLAYFSINTLLKFTAPKSQLKKVLLPIFNLCCFFMSIVVSLYSFDSIKLFIALVLGIILGYLLASHIKKILVFQVLLICLVLPKLVPDLYREVFYSKQWMDQPDAIETIVFIERPNIYLIQPDGYAGFSSFKDSVYNFDNSQFENFLDSKGFKTYSDFRSNYSSTLSSNSSLFAMKHHYYGNKDLGINPRHNARNAIVESNTVLRTLKHNNYKTFLMLQIPYLLSNRPNIDFDYCNISLDEISYISRGFSGETNLMEETKAAIKANTATSNFFFIESMLPSHITTHFDASSSVENERIKYLKRIELANQWLKELVNFITKKDPNGLIVIAADHGGFVGLTSSLASLQRTDNPLLIKSIFSSALAIKWPDNKSPKFDYNLKTSVNLFRILFAHLSKDDTLLNNLQEDKSYIVIRKDAPTGVYEYINEKGIPVFKTLEANE